MQINKKTDKLEVSQINVVNFSEIKANTNHKGDIDRSFALPESRFLLKNELANSICLREINENYQVYLVEGNKSPTIMREIGRLREIAFQFVGEGTGKVWDIDDYDAYYQQIVLWDSSQSLIIGGYRIAKAKAIIEKMGIKGLYNHRLFEFHEDLLPKLKQGVELGRSFINPQHWGRRHLDYLWMGIGAFLAQNSDIRYLFGAVSISNAFPKKAQIAIVQFYRAYFGEEIPGVNARNRFKLPKHNPYFGDDYRKEFKHLVQFLNSYGLSVPPLYKHYSELAEMDGVSVLAFNVDPYFNYCVDALMIVDREKIKAKKAQRYIFADTKAATKKQEKFND